MKKIAIFALLVGGLSVLAGAQTPKPEWLSKGQYPLTKEKVTFNVLMQSVPNVTDFSTNQFTQWLETKTNVRLNFIMAPYDAGAQKEKLNLLIAAGDLPEILIGMNIDASTEARFGSEEKIFLPLNKYINDPKVMPNLNAWLAKNPTARGTITGVDGNIYGFPEINECYHCSLQQKMWINQDWLKKLGLKMPTTTEEFYKVLKAFKEKDPNGNGKADEIPLMGATDSWNTQAEPFLVSSFILDSGMYNKMKLLVDTKSGKVSSILDQTAYKEAMKYLARLYKEELYYNNSITQKNDQAKQLMAMDPAIIGVFPSGYPGIMIDSVAQNALWRAFTILPPLKGPNGYSSTPLSPAGLTPNRVVFTKALKNPELAARWVDSFYSYDFTSRKYWGAEGTDWRWAKPGETGLDGKPAVYKVLSKGNDVQNIHWGEGGINFNPAAYRFGLETTPGIDLGSPDGLEAMLLQVTAKIEPQVRKDVVILPTVKFTVPESEELQLLQVELERYSEQQRVAFETGAQDVEKGWAAYVKKLNDLGLQKFLAIQQKAYDRQYKAKK